MTLGRVVLVFPKVVPDRPGSDDWTLLPLSLLSIASPLLESGFEVEVIDQRVDPRWRDTLADALEAGPVVCVAVSAMTGLPIDGALKASELVKATAPAVPVVWGGVHASLLPEQTAASPSVDYVVVGEGERAFSQLVDALASGADPLGVPGVRAVRGGQLAGTPAGRPIEMDTLARPAYGLVDVRRYLNAPFMTTQRPLAFVTSRGCSGRCNYCYNLAFNQGRWRAMSPERVLSDIRHLVAEYAVDSLFLLDDNFFANWSRAADICDGVLAEGLDVTFLNANCRVSTLDSRSADDLDLLRRAGFQKLFIGVESGSDEVLRIMGKDTTVEQVRRVNVRLREAGIVPVYSFMLGLPGETTRHMRSTLALMLELVERYP
ncbi:MAG TPA: radical SAM protein, partial [Coriobacteriia bacterium]